MVFERKRELSRWGDGEDVCLFFALIQDHIDNRARGDLNLGILLACRRF